MATGRIGVTPTLRTRWSKAPAGGTTSLSGLDDNSVSLVYDVGYEGVYRNGVLLSRGNDYTATDGTTITLIDATITGDIIEVFANELIPLSDAISKGQYTAKGALLSATAASTPGVLTVGSNNQVLTADSSTSTGLKWAGVSSGLTLVKRASFTSVADTGTTFDDVFTTTYKSYLVNIEGIFAASSGDDLQIQGRYTGPTTQAATYYGYSTGIDAGGNPQSTASNNAAQLTLSDFNGSSATAPISGQLFFQNVGNGSQTFGITGQLVSIFAGVGYTVFTINSTARNTYMGFLLKSASSNITGTVSVYGLATA